MVIEIKNDKNLKKRLRQRGNRGSAVQCMLFYWWGISVPPPPDQGAEIGDLLVELRFPLPWSKSY